MNFTTQKVQGHFTVYYLTQISEQGAGSELDSDDGLLLWEDSPIFHAPLFLLLIPHFPPVTRPILLCEEKEAREILENRTHARRRNSFRIFNA